MVKVIVDMFTVYNEKELLEFHVNHVYDLVDKIIIIEGDRTYDGRPYESRLNLIDPKIEHHIVPLKENPASRWENEALQRMMAGHIAAKYDGTLFFECVDEIIHPAFYTEFTEPHCLSLDNYYYYFNGKDVGEKSDHPMPIALPTRMIGDLHQTWEQRHAFPTISHAGWHFSYLGGIDRIKQKLEAYSHAEFDTKEVKDNLTHNIAMGRDIFGRPDHKFEFVPIDNSFPDELVNNQDKYQDLIHE